MEFQDQVEYSELILVFGGQNWGLLDSCADSNIVKLVV